MQKRYQVFVSSTFADLQDERQEVIQALLELDCIPAGMELFPAANDDQWTLIKRVIDDCDYYIVIVGGRYGSRGPDGTSYTEMEFRYALETMKPVLGFLHRDPASIAAKDTEADPEGKEKLEAFRKAVEERMCKYWTSAADLGSKVSRSIVNAIKTVPAVGWVRADSVSNEESLKEILDLQKEVDRLQMVLQATRTEAPPGTEQLASEQDRIVLGYSFRLEGDWRSVFEATVELSWNDIFSALAPRMIGEASEHELRSVLGSVIQAAALPELKESSVWKDESLHDFSVTSLDFDTIKIQLKALGLIVRSMKQRSLKDSESYWTLTPYGDATMTRLRAVKK